MHLNNPPESEEDRELLKRLAANAGKFKCERCNRYFGRKDRHRDHIKMDKTKDELARNGNLAPVAPMYVEDARTTSIDQEVPTATDAAGVPNSATTMALVCTNFCEGEGQRNDRHIGLEEVKEG